MTEGVRIRFDPHVHSEGSYDGKEPVELILEHAADIGLDAVAVTDHDQIAESLQAAELAEEYGLIGVPGVEVSTQVGHLLALGVEEQPEKRRPLKETREWIQARGGAAVVPHPFQHSRHGIGKRHIKEPDAIEVYNAWLLTGYQNRRAQRFAEWLDIPGVAASDAHSIVTIGRAYTEIVFPEKESKEEIDCDDIVEAIKNGNTAVQGRRVPVHRSAAYYGKAAVRKSAHQLRRLF